MVNVILMPAKINILDVPSKKYYFCILFSNQINHQNNTKYNDKQT